MHKAILDRSIFHRDKFEQIKQSKLLEKTRKGRVQIYFTPVFVEESLQLGFTKKCEFDEQIEFLFSLNPARWFKAPSDIIRLELGSEATEPRYCLMSKEDIQSVIDGCRNFIANKISDLELKSIESEIKQNNELKDEFRKQRLEMRAEVPFKKYDFDRYFEDNVDWYIENGLMKFHTDSTDYLKRWKSERNRFRFTEQYIRAWFATVLMPVIDHNVKVDRNDRADAEQLAFLHWTHMIVSEDTQFMQKGFELLFSGKGKRLMNLHEFLLFVDSL
jgi:hypothetical protein